MSSSVSLTGRSRWIAALLVVLFAGWVQFTTARETHVPVPGGPDAGSYVSYAYNLRTFGIYSRERTWQYDLPPRPRADAISTPGYPLFLVPFMEDRPDLAFMARVVTAQAVLGTVTALLVFLFAARVGGLGAGIVTGLLVSITPHLATINTYLLTETLFAFLLAVSLCALLWAQRAGRAWRWSLVGLAFGACCLVRPTLQALVPLVVAGALLAPGRKERLRSPAWAAVAIWCVVLLPWFAYKQGVPPSPGQPDLFRTTLYHGSFPDFRYGDLPAEHGTPYREDPAAAENMASTAGLMHSLGTRVSADPIRYLRWYLVGKPASFLAWDNTIGGEEDAFIYRVDATPWLDRPVFRVLHALMHGLHAPLMIAGLLGAVVAVLRPRAFPERVDRGGARVLGGVALAAVAFHIIGAPYPRYGIPFWPVFYTLAVIVGLTALRAMQAASARSRETGTP